MDITAFYVIDKTHEKINSKINKFITYCKHPEILRLEDKLKEKSEFYYTQFKEFLCHLGNFIYENLVPITVAAITTYWQYLAADAGFCPSCPPQANRAFRPHKKTVLTPSWR